MTEEPRYIGLVTRTVAFALDAALINVAALLVEFGFALILQVLHVSKDFKTALLAIGAVAYAVWIVAYFVGFWSATGETPGDRVMRIRVVPLEGGRITPRRAFVRCLGLVLSALPFFAGYLMILFDARRRALHDRVARTVVVESPGVSLAAARRARRRAEQGPRSSHSGDERGAVVSQA